MVTAPDISALKGLSRQDERGPTERRLFAGTAGPGRPGTGPTTPRRRRAFPAAVVRLVTWARVMAATRKPVLLGLRDAAVPGCPTGPSAWTASKLGGVADALPGVAAPRPECAACGRPLALVVQVYCPLEGSALHRLLHVFACARSACARRGSHSWRVFRSQSLLLREKAARDPQEKGLAAVDWCEGADDWGSDSEEASQLTRGSGSAFNGAKDVDWTGGLQHLHLHDPGPGAALPSAACGERKVSPSAEPQFLPFYICVVEEEDYRDPGALDHAHSLLREYQQREGVDLRELLSQSFPCADNEKYEKTTIKSGDKTFYKFMKRISVCQEQILRYSWSGEPLFMTRPPSVVSDLPACTHCGGQRTFEFQLMPALVSVLISAHSGLSVEFGTILIYTCEKSCWPLSQRAPMEELCVVQEDPDDALFK